MNYSIASWLGLAYLLSEIGLALKKRADEKRSRAADKGSLGLLWFVIVLSVAASFSAADSFPAAGMSHRQVATVIGSVMFVAGSALRWYSIAHLGRFFTVNVAIAADHRLIDTGPYRLVRHPSYTGALMAFVGLALCLANWASLVVMVVPVFLVFRRRMQIEEAALLQAFGDEYRSYISRTKRLFPAVY